MTDFLRIQPVKTFDAGFGLKTADSDPCEIEAGHARELVALGLAIAVEAKSERASDDAMSAGKKQKAKPDAET